VSAGCAGGRLDGSAAAPLPARSVVGAPLGVADVRSVTVAVRIAKVVSGLVLVVAGVAMLVLPGPGLLTIALGVALVLSQSAGGQRLLARLRVGLRERYGSHRVRRVERCLPDEVCPPNATAELRELAEGLAVPPAEGR
jgi:hypothetical protein